GLGCDGACCPDRIQLDCDPHLAHDLRVGSRGRRGAGGPHPGGQHLRRARTAPHDDPRTAEGSDSEAAAGPETVGGLPADSPQRDCAWTPQGVSIRTDTLASRFIGRRRRVHRVHVYPDLVERRCIISDRYVLTFHRLTAVYQPGDIRHSSVQPRWDEASHRHPIVTRTCERTYGRSDGTVAPVTVRPWTGWAIVGAPSTQAPCRRVE